MQVRFLRTAALAAMSLAMASSAHAQLFAYEGFNYVEEPGTSVTGLNGGTGWLNAWPGATAPNAAPVLSTGLSFPGVNNNVGQAMRFATGSNNLSSGRQWGTDPISDGTFWYSFMVRPSLNGQGTLIPFRDPTGSVDGQNGAGVRIDRVQDAGVTTNTVNFRAWSPVQAAGPNILFPNGVDRTYYVIGRLIVDTVTAPPPATFNKIWVIQDSQTLPTNETELEAITTTSQVGIGTLGGVTTLSRILSGRAFSTNAGIGYDEIRIGGSFNDILPGLGPVVPTWVGPVSGDYFRSSNWQASVVPNGVGATAQFFAASSPRTVFADQAVTLGTLSFAGTNRYNLTGNGTLNLDVATGSAAINVQSGSHKINLPLSLADNTTATIATGAELVIADPLSLNGNTLSVSGAGTLSIISTVNPGTSGGFTVGGAALRAGMNLGGSSVTVDSGSVTFEANQQLSGLTIGTGGSVEIGRNLVAVDYTGASPVADLAAASVAGRLTSSALSLTTAVAVVDNVGLGLSTFAGQPVDASTILIRLTLRGDANLDGTVNFPDLLVLARSYNQTVGAGWEDGDSNLDGAVNFPDLLGLARNYNQTLSASEAALVGDAFASDWALALAVVPEPTTAVAIGAASLVALRRRR